MTVLRDMMKAHADGERDHALNLGVSYLSDCLAEVKLMAEMRALLKVPASEGVTRSLTVLIINLIFMAKRDRHRFDALLSTCQEFLADDEGVEAMWELFEDYPQETATPSNKRTAGRL